MPENLLTANQRWRDARDRFVTALATAEKAPQADASAAMLAVAEGSKLPPITAGKAQAQAEDAHRILDASEGLAVRAEQGLLDAVDTHREALTQAQQARVESALDRVDDALNALAEAMSEAGMELARLITVSDEQYGNPLSTSMPMRWDIYDSRVDATVDARGWIDAIRDYAHQSRPKTPPHCAWGGLLVTDVSHPFLVSLQSGRAAPKQVRGVHGLVLVLRVNHAPSPSLRIASATRFWPRLTCLRLS